MLLTALVLFHTALSLVALVAGCPLIAGLLRGRDRGDAARLFLVTALLTSATGFLFPFTQPLPSHAIGIIALLVLAVTIPARYRFGLRGAWRWVYAVGAVVNLYLLVFVLIAQLFGKIPALQAAAPTLSEPPFAITQAATFVFFAILGIAVSRKFHLATQAA